MNVGAVVYPRHELRPAPQECDENHIDFIKSLSILLEEFEYDSSDFATQKMV